MGEFHEFNKIIQTKNELQKCKQIEMQQEEKEGEKDSKSWPSYNTNLV